MKKDEVPTLSAKWWKDSQPAGLRAAKGLNDVLASFEDSRAKLERTPAAAPLETCLDALTAIGPAADKVRVEAERAAKGAGDKALLDDLRFTAEAMKKFARVCVAERAKLEKLAPADAAQEEDLSLNDPDRYHEYLSVSLRQVKQGPRMFAAGVAAKAADCRAMFHRTRVGESLAAEIRRKLHLRKIAWGVATTDDEKPNTMIFTLESDPVPGLKRKCERMLHVFRPQPIARIELWKDGVEIEDLPDDEEESDEAQEALAAMPAAPGRAAPAASAVDQAEHARLRDTLLKLGGLIPAALAANPGMRETLVGLLTRARGALDTDLGATRAIAAELAMALRGAHPAAPGAQTQASPSVPADIAAVLDGALDDWRLALVKADDQLRALRNVLAASRVPQLVAIARTELDGVIGDFEFRLADATRALMDAPPTPAAVGQLRKVIGDFRTHLATDPRVAACDSNPFNVVVAIRPTVSAALDALEHSLADGIGAA